MLFFKSKISLNKKTNKSIDLPKDKKNILRIGRLTKQKNFKYLIKEFENFSKIIQISIFHFRRWRRKDNA